MQKWEYLEMLVQSMYWIDSMGRSGRSTSQFHPEYLQCQLCVPSSLINELGEQGWELTGVASGTMSDTLFFKRPRP